MGEAWTRQVAITIVKQVTTTAIAPLPQLLKKSNRATFRGLHPTPPAMLAQEVVLTQSLRVGGRTTTAVNIGFQ